MTFKMFQDESSRQFILDGLVESFMAGDYDRFGVMCALARHRLRSKGILDKGEKMAIARQRKEAAGMDNG